MASLPVGINTYSYTFSHTARQAMEHLADMGYSAFEILVTPPHLWVPELSADERNRVRDLIAERGLNIMSLNFPMLDNNLTSPTAEVRRYCIDVYKDLIALASDWGAPYVIILPGRLSTLFPAPREWMAEWFAAAMRELGDYAADHGIQLLVENIPFTFIPRVEDIVETLDAIGDARIGIIYDVANGHFVGEDPALAVRLVRDRLELVHLSDTTRTSFRHDPVGAGDVDFQAFAAALVDLGYDGYSMMELISPNPNTDIPDSHAKLARWGWAAPGK
jgi:sugar phosphate isomerase/epimerase